MNREHWQRQERRVAERNLRLRHQHDTPEAFHYRERYCEDLGGTWIPNPTYRMRPTQTTNTRIEGLLDQADIPLTPSEHLRTLTITSAEATSAKD